MFNTGTFPFGATPNTFSACPTNSIPNAFVPNFFQGIPSAFFGYANAPFAMANSPFAQQAWNNSYAAGLQNTFTGRPQTPSTLNNPFASAFNPFNSTAINPFANTTINPFANTTINPFANSPFAQQNTPFATVFNPVTGQFGVVPTTTVGWNWLNAQNTMNPAFFANTTGANTFANLNTFTATPWGVIPTAALINAFNPATPWGAFSGFGATPAIWNNTLNGYNPVTGQNTVNTQNGQPATGSPSLFRDAA